MLKQDIVTSITAAQIDRLRRLEEEIKIRRSYDTQVRAAELKIPSTLKKLNEALKPVGFEISEFGTWRPTGMSGNWKDWVANTELDEISLNINLRLKMIGRRRPIADKGYDKHGRDRSDGRRGEIVDKAKAAVKAYFTDQHVGFDLNQFSLDKKENILATVWVYSNQ